MDYCPEVRYQPKREQKQRRGKRTGQDAKLRAALFKLPLQTLLLANVRSLTNKMDVLPL